MKIERLENLIFENETVSVITTLKNDLLVPNSFKKLPFDKIKTDILGPRFEVSIVVVGKKRMKTLNSTYRQKNYATDVLAFDVDKTSGEIFICPHIAKIKSKDFDMTYENYLLFLVIHAMLHLKGMEHNSRMERHELTYYNRYRYRNL